MAQSKLEVITMNKKLFLDYDEHETVLNLKNLIYLDADIKVPPSKQRLYYFGKLLEDHMTLGKYNINPNKYVLVMIHDTKTHHAQKINLRKTKRVHRSFEKKEEEEGETKSLPRSISDYELKNLIASKLGRSLNLSEFKKNNIEDYFTDYCTFEGYKADPNFRNLVYTMHQPTDSTQKIEEAVQQLVESNSKVLDLIYENMEEFLNLCCEPEKIGDATF